jgi:membrane-associated phospholipid phosphatase
MKIKQLISLLSGGDFISIWFLLFLTGLNVVFHGRVAHWWTIALVNLALIAVIFTLAWLAEQKRTKLLIGLHRWYCYAIVLFIFKELYLMVHPIHPTDYDELLIAVDHWIFGVNPTQWMAQFAHPLLTEILQIAYFSYYFLFIILGVEVYRRFAIEKFDQAAFLVIYGFYLSYLGYFSFPAVGPRFTLHDFSAINTELPGIFLTNAMREIINIGESIPTHLPNPVEFVQRDVFPSGHTELTIITMALGFRYKLKSRWILAVLGNLLIVATVYLRYHYVIDLIAGGLLAWFTIWSGDKLEAWWRKTAQNLRGRIST